MNVAEWLAATARLRPQSPALLRGFDLEADYETFARRAAAIGAALSPRLRHRSPATASALFATNCTQYLECLYGIWWIGAAAIPINAKLHGREAAWICSDAGAKLTFVSDDTIEALAEAASDLPASMKTLSMDSDAYRKLRDGEGNPSPLPREVDDLAWLFYTSGTTGRPKGVMLSHGNLVAATLCYMVDVDPGDAGRCLALCRADLARRRSLSSPACPHGRAARHSRLRRLRSGRSAQYRPAARQCRDVRSAHHGAAAGRCRQTPRRERRGAAHHHLWRRADVSRRHQRRHRHHGPALCADLRPG